MAGISDHNFAKPVGINHKQALVQYPQASSSLVQSENEHIVHDHCYFTNDHTSDTKKASNSIQIIKRETNGVLPAIEMIVKVEEPWSGEEDEIIEDTSNDNDIKTEKIINNEEPSSEDDEEMAEELSPSVEEEEDSDQGNPADESTTGETEWFETCPLFQSYQQIFMDPCVKETVACRECSKQIRVFDRQTGTVRFDRFVSHVCVHLNLPGYFCRFCNAGFKTESGVRGHLQNYHRLTPMEDQFTGRNSDYQRNVMELIEWCFGRDSANTTRPAVLENPNVNNVDNRKQKYQWSPLVSLCKEILANCKDQEAIICRQCNKRIRLINCDVINHAYIHLGIAMFLCSHCHSKFKLKATVRAHIKQKHHLPLMDNYVDLSKHYQKEIVQMVKTCFGQYQKEQNDAAPSTSSMKTKVNKKKISIPKSLPAPVASSDDDELAIARKTRMVELLQKCKYQEKIHCHICEKDIPFSVTGKVYNPHFGWNYPLDHVREHLGKPIFQCRLCPQTTSTYTSITRHIKNQHHPHCRGRYEDFSKEYHTELMELISICYEENNMDVD